MPFIKPEIRDAIAVGGTPEAPGDLCYVEFKRIVDEWNKSPKWATVHNIYKGIVEARACWETNKELEIFTARELAWQVFFHLKIMPYELQKQAENGDIE